MSGFHPTFRSLCLQAVAYGSSGGASNLAVKTLTIGALSQAASWQRSLCIANVTDRIDTVLLNALVTCCARVARWQEALQILCSSLLSHSLQASVVTFNAAISACAASQQWQLAINFIEEMEGQKLAPDSLTFNSAFFVRLVCQIFLTGLVHCGSRGATGEVLHFLKPFDCKSRFDACFWRGTILAARIQCPQYLFCSQLSLCRRDRKSFDILELHT